ncbi:hypothetical protein TruAng_002708 [Truncatella angustata]|nr:hypothetical protein TruAng_002708 [Truncatella angustata]
MLTHSNRNSVDDGDDDLFYSIPPTRHVSVATDETPPVSLLSIKSALDSPLPAVGDSKPLPILPVKSCPSRVGWPLPYQHEPEHHRFCAKPMIDHFAKRRSSLSKSGTNGTLSHLDVGTAYIEEPLTIEQLVSSPADPVTTKCWSSTSIGSYLSTIEPHSPNPTRFDDAEAVQRGIKDIVFNIRVYLKNSRHDHCLLGSGQTRSTQAEHQNSQNQSHDLSNNGDRAANEMPESFLVSSNDIAGILDIVISGLRRIHGQDIPSGCFSARPAKDENAKLTTRLDSIVPPPSLLAEPTTTVSSVLPLFSVPQLSSSTWSAVNDNNVVKNRPIQSQAKSNTLYQRGIDAHTGRRSPPLSSEDTEQASDSSESFRFPDNDKINKATRKGMGSTIGPSSRKRTSSAQPQQRTEPTPDTTLDKLRRFSFPSLEDQPPGALPQFHGTYHTKSSKELLLRVQRKRSSQAILKDILAQADSASMKPTCGRNDSSSFLSSLARKSSDKYP